MHIPDGYLGPPTYVAGYAICAPLWAFAARKIRRSLDARRVPLLAISAAFSFLVMMFNIPLPGATTGHAVGGVLIAIAVGPWGAFLSISIALVVQALLFGDGGITAIGANCFNIAFVMPFSGYFAYTILTKANGLAGGKGKAAAAGIAGWFGLNVSAFAAAMEFGIQPLLHTGADGRALYAPYPLSVALPAMMFQHLVVFGAVEGIVTGMVVHYLQRSRSSWMLLPAGEDTVK